MRRALITLVVPAVVVAAPARAQDSTAEHTGGWCFRGRPRGTCSQFVLLEETIQWHFAGSGAEDFLLTGTLGFMRNVGTSAAFGVAGFVDGDGETVAGGMTARYRRWLGQTSSLDLELGTLLFTESYLAVPSPVVGVKWGVSDLVGLTTRLEVRRYDWGTTVPLYLGAEARSWAALTTIPLTVVGFFIGAAIALSSM